MLLLLLWFTSGVCTEQGRKLEVNVDGSDAARALLIMGGVFGVQVLFDRRALEGRRARPVKGRFDLQGAFRRQLEGSGLDFAVCASGIVVVGQRDNLSGCSFRLIVDGPKAGQMLPAETDVDSLPLFDGRLVRFVLIAIVVLLGVLLAVLATLQIHGLISYATRHSRNDARDAGLPTAERNQALSQSHLSFLLTWSFRVMVVLVVVMLLFVALTDSLLIDAKYLSALAGVGTAMAAWGFIRLRRDETSLRQREQRSSVFTGSPPSAQNDGHMPESVRWWQAKGVDGRRQ